MTWADVFKFVTAALAAVGGGGVIILGFSSWLGKVWANKILEKDKFKYSQELELLRSANRDLYDSLAAETECNTLAKCSGVALSFCGQGILIAWRMEGSFS